MKNKFYFLLHLLPSSPRLWQASLLLPLLLLLPAVLFAQKPAKPNAADLHHAIKKLNVLGSVMYVAAHPDDENTRMISYLSNEKRYDVTYLSMTRGDGGQNLIGPEISALLGVLRTQELLMARSVDGGKQLFTRANDFGFSKNPEETLQLWDKEKVLSDVVWAFRKVQPDVVINRFYHDKKYDTHGHHTASAMLSVEAFDLSGKTDAYPEQLNYVKPWQPQRQFFNTSWFFFGGQEAFEKMDKSNLFSLDLGVYLPLKGKSNNEVAAESRSMHRCQGFGMLSSRGSSMEYLDFVKGERPAQNDIFEGLNTTWTRVEGGEPIGKLLSQVDRNFRSDNPAASVPDLLQAMQMIRALPDSFWKLKKLSDIKEVIRGCLGIYLEATAAEPIATPGETVKIRLEVINRSDVPVTLGGVSILPGLFDTIYAKNLESNKGFVTERKVKIPENAPATAPYWLQMSSTNGMYSVENQLLRGLPETPRYATVRWSLSVGDIPLEYDTDVAWKTGEPAVGEVWRPFEVLPPVFVEFTESSYIFTGRDNKVTVRVKAGRDSISGTVTVLPPGKGWAVRGEDQPFSFAKRGEEKTFTFTIEGNNSPGEATLMAGVKIGKQLYTNRLVTIKYDHIPQQSVLLPSTAHAARLDLQVKAKNVGYVMGAGDDIPAALRQMGCSVTILEDKDMEALSLAKYDAIVIGIRAYNTKDNLKYQHPALLEYVQNGGTLVVQYHTNFELVVDKIAPYPLKISRTRVTDEGAEVRFLLPDHPVLNAPNKLTAKDFDGWVQERGLYFPGEWDGAFEAPLSANDPGEKPADGSLLIAKYGKGYYVYTGLSFFRELPAGVPGAYRLFANLISIGK
ncbi:MAG TPA: PIG-L family deacetylase [Saprospiraceae bacterium]|nr:PIG-L family deacetylase [Saprospiraceae bacterium]